METGKILIMVAFLVLGVVFGSTIGFSVGKASGNLEATSKFAREQLDEQQTQIDQTSGAYGSIPSDPLQDVTVNPFE